MFYNLCKGAFWAVVAVTLMAMAGFAQADRVIGGSLSQIGEDVSWGAHANIPFATGEAKWGFDAVVQGGDQIRGKANLDVSRSVGGVDLGIFTKHGVRGYSLSGLGRTSDIGLKMGKRFGDVSFSLGVFGRNGGVFADPNALKTLEDNGYDIGALEGLGLELVNPAPTGLSIKAGSSVNALVAVEFDLSFAHVKVEGMPELSASEDAVHQLITTLSSSWDLTDQLELSGTLDIGFQSFGGTLEREIANLWTVDYEF